MAFVCFLHHLSHLLAAKFVCHPWRYLDTKLWMRAGSNKSSKAGLVSLLNQQRCSPFAMASVNSISFLLVGNNIRMVKIIRMRNTVSLALNKCLGIMFQNISNWSIFFPTWLFREIRIVLVIWSQQVTRILHDKLYEVFDFLCEDKGNFHFIATHTNRLIQLVVYSIKTTSIENVSTGVLEK